MDIVCDAEMDVKSADRPFCGKAGRLSKGKRKRDQEHFLIPFFRTAIQPWALNFCFTCWMLWGWACWAGYQPRLCMAV